LVPENRGVIAFTRLKELYVLMDNLEVLAQTPLPTRHGLFQVIAFKMNNTPEEHLAIFCGELKGAQKLPVRVHSECFTSEVIGSLKCDCREQLETALSIISRQGRGVVVYLRQEGRGIGLVNKLKAYALQAQGHDTVDANRILGLPDDTRSYEAAAAILTHLGVESVSLLTNNPLKVEGLQAFGIKVIDRKPVLIRANQHSAGYLEAKRLRMGHMLPKPTKHNTPNT
jgi:GTP cyclohydrolase II